MKIMWKQVIVALLLGAVLGLSAGRACGFKAWRHGDSKDYQQRMLARLTSEVGLDAGQQVKVQGILDQKKVKFDALRAEMRPKFETLKKETREEIRLLLKPEQYAKFNALNAKMDEKWNKRDKK
jgi:hypothetical protein